MIPLDPAVARAALAAALCDLPPTIPVVWAAGTAGGASVRLPDATPSTITAELRAHITEPHPKGEGAALVPVALDPARERLTRDAIETVSLVVVDHDAGTHQLGRALAELAALGVAAWGYPSPSAPLGPPELATRWRVLLPLRAGTAADRYVALVPALAAALESVLGARLDRGPLRPESLCYVAPRPEVGARSPYAVLWHHGGALDLGALADAAAAGGWWTTRESQAARDARRAGVRDGTALVAVLDAAGLVMGAADRRGWAPLRCPRERWHGSGGGKARRDSSSAVHRGTGACRCSHDHSLAPADQRGPATTGRILAWLREDHPELAPTLALARDAGRLAETRAALAGAPAGEAPRRVVAKAAVADDLCDALARAQLGERLVLHTPTVAAGKSRATGAAVGRALRDGAVLPPDDASAPLASAVIAVRDRAAIAATVLAVLRDGASARGGPVEVRVYTPVHEVLDSTGGRECTHHVAAERLYRRGASARASLCGAVPTPTGTVPCARRAECRARDPWVRWTLAADGTPRQTQTAAPPGVPWVAVVPHASAHAALAVLREGGPVVVDEADPALAPVAAELDAAALRAAHQWAAALAPVATHGSTPGDSHAPRFVATAIAGAAVATGAAALAAIPPHARRAWCLACFRASALTHRRIAGWLRSWVAAADSVPVEEVAALAIDRWIEANVTAVRPRVMAELPRGGGAALAALQRWAAGCHARVVADDDAPDDARLALAWGSGVGQLCRYALDRRGGVVALDATGDPRVARDAMADPVLCRTIEHDPVRVDGGADVRRVLVASSRAGRRALAPRGGVQWDAAGDALAAAAAALRGARREGFGRGDGLVVTARPVAMACEALAAAGPSAEEEAVRAAVEAHRAWADLPPTARERVMGAALAAPAAVRELVAELAAAGDVRWTWWGSVEARGSNTHAHRGWCVTLGDGRPSVESVRSSLWARTGEAPTDASERAAADREAAAAHAQAHGRLRALQRDGERLAMIHVGRVPPLDWHQLPELPVVVTPSGARQWAAVVPEHVEAPPATAAAVAEVIADLTTPVASTAHPDVRAAAAAGWSLSDLHRATGCERATARAWWRGERAPRSLADRAAVRALAAGESTPTLRAVLSRLVDGRGWARLWRGIAECEGLGRRLERAGHTAPLDAVRRWAETRDAPLPVEVVGAIARVMPELVVMFPPARPLPERPLPALALAAGPADRPGPVPARPTTPPQPRPERGPSVPVIIPEVPPRPRPERGPSVPVVRRAAARAVGGLDPP